MKTPKNKTKPSQDPLDSITRKRRFKILGVDTRVTFLLVQSVVEGNSKELLTVATFVFAGSMTFLGLRHDTHDTIFLQLSWAALGISILLHLLVRVALLDALMAHGRTETDNNQAIEVLKEKGELAFFAQAFSSFFNDGIFRKSANLMVYFLIAQTLVVIAGCVLMGIFVWNNL